MSPEPPKMIERYLTDDELAALLRISIARLRNKISAGEPLPPYIRPPGFRKRLWHSDRVSAWLSEYTIGGNEAPWRSGFKIRASPNAPSNRVKSRRSKTLIRL